MKTLKELKELYKTLAKYVYQYDDGFIYAIWHKDKNEFLEYMENWNINNGEVIKVVYKQDDEFVYPLGQIYLMKDENKISPYREWYQTKQDIISEAKKQFDKLNSDTVNNNNNSESDNNNVIEEEI